MGQEELGVPNRHREWSQGPSGVLRGVRRPTQRAGISWEKSDTPLRGQGGVRSHYRLARSGREALSNGREGSEEPSGWLGGWKPSQKGRKSQESLPEARRGHEGS